MSESNFNPKILPDGVQHGPYLPTENPYEQTDQHRAALGAAHYEIGDIAFDELSAGLDQQEQATTDAVNNRDYDLLGGTAGAALAEDLATADIPSEQELQKMDAEYARLHPDAGIQQGRLGRQTQPEDEVAQDSLSSRA